ncbi:CRISPR-associated protein, Cas5d family [Clostridiaceae bacterium JG1575]|nr:CRISPR-associated protein, Cas5d family [Clostridiaceae bacterium JG1575]
MRNSISFKVHGRYALFSDPITRVGGEKFSYQIPTYEALKGICESIYWKPTFQWVVDSVRIMNPIRMQSQGVRPIFYAGTKANDLSIYTYLSDVEYEVNAHFEWDLSRDDLASDRNEHKHHQIALRMVNKGGRRDIFLGTRECQAYVEPVTYGAKKGYYDDKGIIPFDLMFYRFTYPNPKNKKFMAYFWKPTMNHGEIIFDASLGDLPSRLIRETEYSLPQVNFKDSTYEELIRMEESNELDQ